MTSIRDDVSWTLLNTFLKEFDHQLLEMIQLLLNRLLEFLTDICLQDLWLVGRQIGTCHQCIVPIPDDNGLMCFWTAHASRVYQLVLRKFLHVLLSEEDCIVPCAVDDLSAIVVFLRANGAS